MPNPPESPLLEAAGRLDEELRRYEALTEEVARATVHSRKSLTRVARMLQQAGESHELLLQHVASLSEVMNATRLRQVSCGEKLVSAGGRLQERAAAFQALLVRQDALGEQAKELNASAAEIAARKKDDGFAETLAATGPLLERMESVVTEATTLADAAREADFADLAREVDQMKQLLHHAKNQLLVVRRALGERSPS
jgi:hypothetical protein